MQLYYIWYETKIYYAELSQGTTVCRIVLDVSPINISYLTAQCFLDGVRIWNPVILGQSSNTDVNFVIVIFSHQFVLFDIVWYP